MKHIRRRQKGYVLVSVTAILMTVLAAVVAINQNYTNSVIVTVKIDTSVRDEIEKSAFAHLQAFSEQSNCGVNAGTSQPPNAIKVSGTKDDFAYTLSWVKDENGTILEGTFANDDKKSQWTTSQSNIKLFGSSLSTSWILAPYFSKYLEIKQDKKNQSHTHKDHTDAKVSSGKDIVLRSLKLGPLSTEPVSIISAELQLSPEKKPDTDLLSDLTIHAIKYPWDTDDATFSSTGIGKAKTWPKVGYENFEALPINAQYKNEFVTFDITGLINSWLSNTRPNYGWALSSNTSINFSWVSGPKTDNFETRPRINLQYRCECGEACIGIPQNEVLAMGTLSAVDGYGGGRDKLIKLWLHRAHREYREIDTAEGKSHQRDQYFPEGLSDFAIKNIPGGQYPIGLHIEPSNPDHPDYHYYTLMAGASPSTKSIPELKTNYAQAQLIYLQSAADSPIGTNLQNRSMGLSDAASQLVTDFISDTNFYVGGLSDFDNRFWFGKKKDAGGGVIEFIDVPYVENTGSSTLYSRDSSTTTTDVDELQFNLYHVQDALHVIDENNFLLSAEYTTEAGNGYESELGHLGFHDGDIVLYNTISKTARLIDGDILRGNRNNVFSISLYEEPIPPEGSDDNKYKEALPILFESTYKK